jgi:hypothetical protein
MNTIAISEIPSRIWNFSHYFQLPIDRSSQTVAEYLKQNNVNWIFGDDPHADFRVYKEENLANGFLTFRRIKNEYQKRFEKIPYMNLNGEAQERSRIAYLLADSRRTFSVSPGYKYHRLYFPSEWTDPRLEAWEERLDKICWIGRPLPERIRLAKKISNSGIGLDIYSKDPWPHPNWKGFAPDEIEISRKYRYRIVYENSLKNLYHSEKLFNSIRSGCVTFYIADPDLELSHLKGAFIPFELDAIKQREDESGEIINGIHSVLFSDRWEVYSFRNFFNTIINFARNQWNNGKKFAE